MLCTVCVIALSSGGVAGAVLGVLGTAFATDRAIVDVLARRASLSGSPPKKFSTGLGGCVALGILLRNKFKLFLVLVPILL